MILRILPSTRILFKPQGYFCSLQTKNKKYPYVFGGINIKQSNLHLSLTKDIWPNNIEEQFREAYIAYLQALRDKDKQFLKQVLEQSLLRNIEFEDVKLINENAPIEVQIIKQSIIIGAGFDRRSHNNQWATSKLRSQEYLNLYYSKNFQLVTPVMFSVQVCFRSQKKLVKNSQSNSKNDQELQSHTLQMEVQNKKYNIFSIYPLLIKEYIKSFFDKDKNYQLEIFKSVINFKEVQWKIADVDRILDQNFPRLHKDSSKQ